MQSTNKFTKLPATLNTNVLENGTLFLTYCRTRNLGNCQQLRGSDQTVIQRNPPDTMMSVNAASLAWWTRGIWRLGRILEPQIVGLIHHS